MNFVSLLELAFPCHTHSKCVTEPQLAESRHVFRTFTAKWYNAIILNLLAENASMTNFACSHCHRKSFDRKTSLETCTWKYLSRHKSLSLRMQKRRWKELKKKKTRSFQLLAFLCSQCGSLGVTLWKCVISCQNVWKPADLHFKFGQKLHKIQASAKTATCQNTYWFYLKITDFSARKWSKTKTSSSVPVSIPGPGDRCWNCGTVFWTRRLFLHRTTTDCS